MTTNSHLYFLARSPPDAQTGDVVSVLKFTKNCNDPAVEEEIKTKIAKYFGYVKNVEYHCGGTSIVNRRKRSTATTISLKFNVIAKANADKLDSDPAVELERLKAELRNVIIPNFKATLNNKKNWNVLNKFAGEFSSVRESGNIQEICNQRGSVKASYIKPFSPNKIKEKCGVYSV